VTGKISTLRLIQAGLIAACLQAIAVAVITGSVLLYLRAGFSRSSPLIYANQFSPQLTSALPFLTWAYLLTALGIILTGTRFVDATAFYLRIASRRMPSFAPGGAAKTLLVQLWIAAVGFAVLALRPPPGALVELAATLGCPVVAAIAWPGMMSIGAADFGANAHAAAAAL